MNATVVTNMPSHVAQLRRGAVRRSIWLVVALALLALLVMASVSFGARDVSVGDILGGLGGSTDTVSEAAVVKRIPRTVLAVLVGSALAMSGAVLQAVTRNPIAEPAILGISTGASFAVVVGISFFGLSRPYSSMLVAIIGAAGSAVFVYVVGSLGRGGATPLRLTLAGAAASAAFVSLTSAVMLPRVDLMRTFQFWRIGSIGGASWERVTTILPLLLIGVVICLLCSRGLNSLALGDELSTGLGENVRRTRLLAAVGAVVLCGAAVAVSGPIGFVGLIVPHLCRLVVGTDHRWLLPFCALGGAALLLAADVIGRVIARPEEIEVGIVTAFVGVPLFIWIVRRQKVREL